MSFITYTLLVMKYVFLLLIPYHILLFTYRLFLHPLRKYPGPWLAQISDAYGAWFAFRRQLHLRTYQDHAIYGPIIRQGPNKLVFNSATALQAIYLNHRVSKSKCYLAVNFTLNSSVSNTFDTISKPLHRIKRQRVAPLLSERSMRTFEPKMTEKIDIFLRSLLESCQKSPEAPIDMAQRCKWLGLDIIGQLAFGYELNLQTQPFHRYIVHSMLIASWRLNCYLQFPFLRQLRLELLFQALAIMKGKSFLHIVTKMIQSRLAEDKDSKHDLYSIMIDALNAEQDDKMALKEIWLEAISFVAAGGDTTSTAMSSVFFYLSRNPHCKEKLLKEIEATFKSGADIQAGPQLSSCLYLRACIDEAMRMSPPVPGTLWREQSAEDMDQSKPFLVDGHVIPPGTQVGVHIYSIHHNEEYFPEPFVYKPERWLLTETGLGSPQANRAAFVPFSVGARSCAGKAMAYQEASLALAKAVWFFDFELAEESSSEDCEFKTQDVFVATHTGPFLYLKPRGQLWKELVSEEE